jgi:hypothetical protein
MHSLDQFVDGLEGGPPVSEMLRAGTQPVRASRGVRWRHLDAGLGKETVATPFLSPPTLPKITNTFTPRALPGPPSIWPPRSRLGFGGCAGVYRRRRGCSWASRGQRRCPRDVRTTAVRAHREKLRRQGGPINIKADALPPVGPGNGARGARCRPKTASRSAAPHPAS